MEFLKNIFKWDFLKLEMYLRLKDWISGRKQDKAIVTDIVSLNQLTQKIDHVTKSRFFYQDDKNLETEMSAGWVCTVKSNDREGVH